jgi:branched-chain amino acid transport system substrate-binding protein
MKLKFLITIIFLPAYLISGRLAFSEPYQIGIPLPLTGALAATAQDVRRGFELGREILEINDMKFVFEDDGCDGSKSVTVVKKLLEIDKVDVISGIVCNTALLPVGRIIDRAKVPALTVGSTTGDFTGIGKKIFRIFPSDDLAVSPLIPEIAKAGSHLCMVTESEAYTELIDRTVRREWTKHGGTVEVESLPAGTRDFRSVLLRLTKRGCDGIFLNAAGDDGFIAAYRQLRIVQPDILVFNLYNPASTAVRAALGDILRKTVYVDLQSQSSLATPIGQNFITRYQARYGSFLTASPMALLAFEALRVIHQAHKEGVPLDIFLRRGPIRDGAIRDYSFDGDGAVQGVGFQVFKIGVD